MADSASDSTTPGSGAGKAPHKNLSTRANRKVTQAARRLPVIDPFSRNIVQQAELIGKMVNGSDGVNPSDWPGTNGSHEEYLKYCAAAISNISRQDMERSTAYQEMQERGNGLFTLLDATQKKLDGGVPLERLRKILLNVVSTASELIDLAEAMEAEAGQKSEAMKAASEQHPEQHHGAIVRAPLTVPVMFFDARARAHAQLDRQVHPHLAKKWHARVMERVGAAEMLIRCMAGRAARKQTSFPCTQRGSMRHGSVCTHIARAP